MANEQPPNKNKWTPVVAIIALAAMQIYARSLGYDGTLQTITALIIGGIAGYELQIHRSVIDFVKKIIFFWR